MNSGVYMIQSPSGGVYIGSSVRLMKRKGRHFSELRNNRHPNEILQRAWNKYDGNLNFVTLEFCVNDKLIEREQWWINYILSTDSKLYNARLTADAGGQPLQQSTREKISRATIGRKKSAETRRKMSKPKSPEHAAAISRGKKGTNNITWTDGEREKRRVAMKRRWTTEHSDLSAKIKASWTPERRRKQTAGFEHRRVMKHLEMMNWILAG